MTLLPSALLLSLLAQPAGRPLDPPDRIEELGRRIEGLEEQYHGALADLERLDVRSAALNFDLGLRRIHRAALELEAGPLESLDRRELELRVLDQLGYARFRLRQLESNAVGVDRLSDTLRRMRLARVRGRAELAVALHADLVGDTVLEETAPILLRRLFVALRDERIRADAALAASRPRARPR